MNILGISKVGEGYTVPEDTLPIDIQFNKLVDWLIDRKKVPANWKKNLTPIRVKIDAAQADLPQNNEIAAFVKDRKLNYFDCEKMMELLKKAGEPQDKSLFGSYTSKRMKEWDEIIRQYEKENTFLAESSHYLITNVNYEIPAKRKVIEQCQKQISELQKKEVDLQKTIKSYQNRFKESCRELGIEGKEIREEILSQTKKIPELLEPVVKLAQVENIRKALQFYQEFCEYLLNCNKKEKVKVDLLPTLQYVLKYGNESIGFFQKRQRGEDPTAAPKEEKKSEEEPQKPNQLEIDWTVIDDTTTEKTVDVKEVAEPAINWDIQIEDTGASGQSSEPKIVWDAEETIPEETIEVLESSSMALPPIEVVSVVSGVETETILENNEIRNRFVNDLMELRDFLRQRREELMSKDNLSMVDQFTGASSLIQDQSAESVQSFSSAVQAILDTLEKEKLRKLLEIKNSKRYVDRVVASFHHFLECIERSESSIRYSETKREQLQEVIRETVPKIDAIAQETKILARSIEKALSKQYNNRPVHLVGEITNL